MYQLELFAECLIIIGWGRARGLALGHSSDEFIGLKNLGGRGEPEAPFVAAIVKIATNRRGMPIPTRIGRQRYRILIVPTIPMSWWLGPPSSLT